MLRDKRDDLACSIFYRIALCLLSCFAVLLFLIPYAEAAPPSGGVSPTPPPAVTSTRINLSATKEAVLPADSSGSSDTPSNAENVESLAMPTALPAPPAVPSENSPITSSPLDLDITILASDETSDAVAANLQDDEWRANAAAQGLSFCSRGLLSDSDPTTAGINQTVFGEGATTLSVSYALHEMKDGLIGSPITGGHDSQGLIQQQSFMKESAPIPQELLELGGEVTAVFEEQTGSTNAANGLLFTFSPPGTQAFGAWFGGLSSRAPLEGVGLDGDPRGGKLAYMRLFDADGRQIGPDRAIRPAQKEGESLCLDANEEPIECETANTRWVGFVASQPIAQMLLVVGDHDDSDQVSACRVAADGGTETDFIAQCQGGDEHLSFVGPTICTNAKLDPIAIHHEESHLSNNATLLHQTTDDSSLRSLALTGIALALFGLFALLGFIWYKR